MRARYEALVANPARIEAVLADGARKARALVSPLMASVRHAVGLRNLASVPAGATAAQHGGRSEPPGKAVDAARPSFKQYRERDGRFYFKLVGEQGRVLLQSRGFESPREAGEVIAALQREGVPALAAYRSSFEPPAGDDATALEAALQRLAADE
jgi:tryptophanyl-tRNA synthetase